MDACITISSRIIKIKFSEIYISVPQNSIILVRINLSDCQVLFFLMLFNIEFAIYTRPYQIP